MTGSLSDIVHLLIIAVCGSFSAWAFWRSATRPSCDDHDMNDNLAGPGAKKWKHDYVCPTCRCCVSADEVLTEICLSCGGQMNQWPASAATRSIVRNGRWILQRKINGTSYTWVDRQWVPLSDPKQARKARASGPSPEGAGNG